HRDYREGRARRRPPSGCREPERARTGVLEPAYEREGGDAGRRDDRRAWGNRSGWARDHDRRHRDRDSRRAARKGSGAIRHHQGAWERAGAGDLSLDRVGHGGKDPSGERAGPRHARPRLLAERRLGALALRLARILVVDDEPGMLRAVMRVLSPRHQVVAVATPSEALALLSTFEPDLAILDVRMPEMDGFELTARLKSERPDLDVILMTGSLSELDAKLVRAIRENAFYFIQKPF